MEASGGLLYANPVGHRVPASLKICQKCIKHGPKTSAQCARGAMRRAFVSLIELLGTATKWHKGPVSGHHVTVWRQPSILQSTSDNHLARQRICQPFA